MDNLYLDFQFFAVPNRLLWDNWARMMGERREPDDSIDYLVPQIQTGVRSGGLVSPTVQVGDISDYMGIPPNIEGLSFSALHHRAYNMVWNEWYRDENLQDRVPQHYDDGPDPYADYKLLPRGKRKDYFTSCLPWPQKGESVSIPLGTSAPVEGVMRVGSSEIESEAPLVWSNNNGRLTPIVDTTPESGAVINGTNVVARSANAPGLYADLSQATAATINSLRQAFQLQRLLERDARGGTRLVELIQSHFGVTNPDARMQRPEYLGGGTVPIQIHSVAQTSSTNETTPQGNLAAYGVSAGQIGFSKSFTEHCVVLGLVSVRADLTYQQGLPRMFSRRGRYDFYWPVLSNLGEQAVLNREIFAQGEYVLGDDGEPVDDHVFGYQERWAEYRYGMSKITGKLRSGVSQSLDVWHLAQRFNELPSLNGNFIQDKPPLKRVLAVQDEPEIIFDCNQVIDKIRPMPMYSVPGLIDHF